MYSCHRCVCGVVYCNMHVYAFTCGHVCVCMRLHMLLYVNSRWFVFAVHVYFVVCVCLRVYVCIVYMRGYVIVYDWGCVCCRVFVLLLLVCVSVCVVVYVLVVVFGIVVIVVS